MDIIYGVILALSQLREGYNNNNNNHDYVE